MIVALQRDRGDELWREETEAVARGAVIVAENLGLVGYRDGVIEALDIGDGTRRWFVPPVSRESSAGLLVKVEGTVVASYEVDMGEYRTVELGVIDTSTGTRLWDVDLNTDVASSPLHLGSRLNWLMPADDVLFVLRGMGIRAHDLETNRLDDDLVALDRRRGRERWRFSAREMECQPLLYAGTIYLTSGSPASPPVRLHALDANDGSRRWTRTFTDRGELDVIGASTRNQLLADSRVVCLAGSGGAIGLDVSTGKTLWKVTEAQSLIDAVLVNGVLGYARGGPQTSSVRRFDAYTGREVLPVLGRNNTLCYMLTATADAVYFGTATTLFAFPTDVWTR